MALSIVCPECGCTDDLKGIQTPDGIRITCGACGRSWMRDSELGRCATCGGDDLVTLPLALTQYSRGTQLSIVGISEVQLCRTCDATMVEWAGGTRAVPVSYRPAASDPDAAREREDEGDVRITP
jgi:hypothetical protein